MKTNIISILLCLSSTIFAHSQVTIEQCVEKALTNYPVIQKYNLISMATEIELSDINKSWLPKIGVYGQVTGQNVVPEFPEALSGVLQNMGQEIKGMGKIQYKIGVEVSQTIWDGGMSKARLEVSRAQESVQQSAVDLVLHQVRRQVENLYFAILLADEQIAQSRVTYDLLCKNLERLRSMYRNGVAMQSDIDMVEAQALTINQNIIRGQSASDSYRRALELYIGESLENKTLAMPSGEMPPDAALNPDTPQLKFFNRKLEYIEATNRFTDSSLMPRIAFFTQAHYGYPGFNYFQSMMNRNLSFNILAGVKVAWNIDSFYTKKNRSRVNATKLAEINADKEVFMFNTNIQSTSETETIRGIKNMMKDDSRITALRANVRKAAESQLTNGVIDITALLTKISDENIAMLTSKYHEILLLQEIYKLKYTLDR